MAKKENSVVGLCVKHYQSAFNTNFEPWPQTSDFGESCTDITNWKPKVSDVRAFLSSPNSKQKKFLYDFKPGEEDDGSIVRTLLRSPGLDITEVETAERIVTQIIEDKKASDERKEQLASEQKELLDTIKGVRDSLTKGDSASTEGEDKATE